MTPTPLSDLKRLAKKAKKYWWLGMLLGIGCHLLPPEYKDACKLVINACQG